MEFFTFDGKQRKGGKCKIGADLRDWDKFVEMGIREIEHEGMGSIWFWLTRQVVAPLSDIMAAAPMWNRVFGFVAVNREREERERVLSTRSSLFTNLSLSLSLVPFTRECKMRNGSEGAKFASLSLESVCFCRSTYFLEDVEIQLSIIYLEKNYKFNFDSNFCELESKK